METCGDVFFFVFWVVVVVVSAPQQLAIPSRTTSFASTRRSGVNPLFLFFPLRAPGWLAWLTAFPQITLNTRFNLDKIVPMLNQQLSQLRTYKKGQELKTVPLVFQDVTGHGKFVMQLDHESQKNLEEDIMAICIDVMQHHGLASKNSFVLPY